MASAGGSLTASLTDRAEPMTDATAAMIAAATTIWFDVATARITEKGRSIDFDREPAAVAEFDVFHERVVRIEGAKMLGLVALAVVLSRSKKEDVA